MIKTLLTIFLVYSLLLSCGDKTNEHLFDFSNYVKKKKFTEAASFYFVGINESNSSIYKYNIEKKRASVLWYKRNQRVIDLAVDDDFKTAFFVAAQRYGMAGSFPFIDNAKLYRIDPETREVTMLKELGNLVQLYSFWSEEGNYNLIINSFDPKVNTYIIQNTLLYNKFGRLLSDHSETSDLLISGYPTFKLKELKTTAYNNRYRIYTLSDSIFIRNLISKEKIFIKETNHRLNDVEWISDKSLLVFSTIKSGNDESVKKDDQASLNIYDTSQKKIVKSISGSSLYRFTITSEFLIFDEGFERNSRIKILDLKKLKYFDTINIKGGCGLRNVPLNPF